MGVYTNKMRYTGTSGVDVESMVQSLMKAEGMKANKLFKQKTKLEWQQASIRTMGLSIRGFRDNYLSFTSSTTVFNMRSAANFGTRTVSGSIGTGSLSTGSSSSTIKVGGNSTITATPDVPTGDYTVKINSVGSKEAILGTKMEETATSSAALDLSKLEAGDYIDMTVNGSKKRIVIEQADLDGTNEDFAANIQTKIDSTFGQLNKESKVTVSVDGSGNLQFAANDKIGSTFSLTMDDGIANPKTVTGGNALLDGVKEIPTVTENGDGTKLTFKLGGTDFEVDKYTGTTPEEEKAYLASVNAKLGAKGTATLDTDGKLIVQGKTFNTNGTDSYVVGGKTVSVDYKEGGTTADYIKALNTALAAEPDPVKATASLDKDGKVVFTPTTGVENISVAGGDRVIKDADGNVTSTSTIDISGELSANSSAITKIGFNKTGLTSTFDINKSMELPAGKIAFGGTEIEVTADTTYKEFMDKINATGKAKVTFSTTSNSFKVESAISGADGTIDFGDAKDAFAKLKIDTEDRSVERYTSAKNTEIEITNPDGSVDKITRESGVFTYKGMNFNLESSLQKTIDNNSGAGIETNISVAADTTAVYDNITKFLSDYNAMIDSLRNATSTKPAKSDSYTGYDPLTDEEMSGMNETQIKQYEEKAKQGVLYRNPEYERLQTKMREAMNGQITLDDGSKISLASIGITTGEYSNGGKLFVTNEKKLRDALANNADGVSQLFTQADNGVSEKLNKVIDEAVGNNGYVTKKAGFTDSVYVDNNYYSQLIKTKSQDLTRLNDYLMDRETYYYKMFAAMEAAITNSNNQMASLSSYS